jgi:Polyketide cyclase / dehydrase and lipid transport
MLKRLALAVVFASLMPAMVLAHGPTRQKVTQTIEINAPADKVWAVVGNFQDMGWTGIATKTEGTGENGAGAKRTLTVPNGTLEENLLKFNAEGKTYSYELPKADPKVLPVANYSSTITVTPDGDKSKVEWKAAFYRSYGLNDPPPEESDEAAVKAVTGLYEASLANLKKKIEGGS